MGGGIRIGRLFGIDIAIHPSWFIILGLFAFTLANGFFPRTYADWSRPTSWAVAIVATLLLFAAVLAHELGHSLVAKSQGIKVTSIALPSCSEAWPASRRRPRPRAARPCSQESARWSAS